METNILTPKEIRVILTRKLGKDFNRKLADRAGKSGAWVSRHISGTLKTREGRKLIARAAGAKLDQIHP